MDIYLHFGGVKKDPYIISDVWHLFFTNDDVGAWIAYNTLKQDSDSLSVTVNDLQQQDLGPGLSLDNLLNNVEGPMGICISKAIFENDVNGTISSNYIEHILTNFTGIKEVSLSKCKNMADLDLSNIPFDALDKINLSDSNISAAAVQQILRQAKNLKEINLSGCKNLDSLDLPDISLQSLERIDLGCSNISAAAVRQILRQAENLKEINLRLCESLVDLDLSGMSFGGIESINLSGPNISAAAVNQVLSQAKNLKEIYLRQCENLADLDLSNISLQGLELIDLRLSNISAAAVKQIFSQAKNLIVINLWQCKNLADLDLSNIPFDALDRINLSDSNISAATVNQILRQAKNLKEIDLSECNMADLDLSNMPFDALDKINLSDSNISAAAVNQILRQAKNLKEIVITEEQSLSALNLLGVSVNNLPNYEYLSTLINHIKTLKPAKTIQQPPSNTTAANSQLNTAPMYNNKIKQQIPSASSGASSDFNLSSLSTDINELGEDGETHLTRSLSAKTIVYSHVVQLIDSMGADVNIANKEGMTPLYILIKNYNPELNKLIEFLLRRGAKVDKTLLVLAEQKGCTHLFPIEPLKRPWQPPSFS